MLPQWQRQHAAGAGGNQARIVTLAREKLALAELLKGWGGLTASPADVGAEGIEPSTNGLKGRCSTD